MPPSRLILVGGTLVVVGVAALVAGLAVGMNSERQNRGSSSLSDDGASTRGSGTPTATIAVAPPGFPPPSLRPTMPPTAIPTTAPTMAPTNIPTFAPTLAPTAPPTPNPTNSPTDSPTRPPTPPLFPADYTFRLKLYWEKGYFWQEESFEREWCLECVECKTLTNSGSGEGCEDKNGKDNEQCERGDQLWLQRCRNNGGNAEFQIRSDHQEGYQFKVKSTNLCIERKGSHFMALDTCNEHNPNQRWIGFKMNEQPFAWQLRDDLGNCVTNQHHPKPNEVIYTNNCQTARQHETLFWEAY